MKNLNESWWEGGETTGKLNRNELFFWWKIKGTVRVISIDPRMQSWQWWWFTTVPLRKALSYKGLIRYKCFWFLILITIICVFFTKVTCALMYGWNPPPPQYKHLYSKIALLIGTRHFCIEGQMKLNLKSL